MTLQILRCSWSFCTVVVVLGLVASVASAQDVTKSAKQPLGAEAYELLTSFYDYDRDIPLDARVVEKRDRANCVREKIILRVGDSLVTAYLGIPKTGSPPYPCVLVLHGITASKEAAWDQHYYRSGETIANALLKDGFAVFSPDAPYHGERTFENKFESPWTMVQQKHMIRFRDLVVQGVIECRRAIDYLETRPEIEAARIGIVGYSNGGIETFALTALDSRVKSSVACVTPSAFLDQIGASPAIKPSTFATVLHDRPFLMLMGRTDKYCDAASAQRLYDTIPGSKKNLIFYESGHAPPVDHLADAVKWLQDGLK
jgi:dienelactone hydrolase